MVITASYKVKVNKSREEKFKELINRVNQGNNEENITQGNNPYSHHSNGNANTNSHKNANKQGDKSLNLYEKGRIKDEIKTKMFQENIAAKEEKGLRACTFKPRTNSASNKDKKNDKPHSIKGKELYDRTVGWKKQNLDR